MFKLLRRMQFLLNRRQNEADLTAELEAHRALIQRRLETDGMAQDEAARASRRVLGNVSLAREDVRAVWMWPRFESLWQDVRYGTRTLLRNGGFAAVAIVTLTLGIGTTTAVFSVVNAILLRPLPYGQPDRLTLIWAADPARDIHEAATSFPTLTDWRTESRQFADIAFWRTHVGNISGTAEPERVTGALASANLFTLLGVQPAIGRTFSTDEERSRDRVVVLSHRLWERRFGRDPQITGRTLEIDGRRLRVIGVMPQRFYFPTKEVEHWEPATLMSLWAAKPPIAERSWTDRFAELWRVVGRLQPHATVRDAQNEIAAIGKRLAERYPSNEPDFAGYGVEVVPMLRQITGPSLERALWILLGAVSFVLLIACANVANLLLARGASRTREFAVRAALGAGRARLARQLVVENLLLAVVAGALGCGLAVAAVRILAASRMPGIPRLDEVSVDASVLAFAAAVSIGAWLLMAIVPAWRLSVGHSSDALKEGSAGAGAGPKLHRMHGLFVVVECTLAVALLAGAGLLIRSLLLAQAVNPGFHTDDVLLARVYLPIPASPQWRRQEWQMFRQLNERIAALPDAREAGAITNFLIASRAEEAITVEGRPAVTPGQENALVNTEDVTPGFFRAVGVPLVAGRFFTYDEQNAPIAIVNQTFARRFFPGEDPIGKRFKEGGPTARSLWITIVGVVGDMRREGLEKQPVAAFFFPSTEPTMDIAVRTTGDPLRLVPAVREAIRSVYREATVVKTTTVAQTLGDLDAQRRFHTALLAAFAFVSLVLSSIGIYGIVHFAVAQRRHELGVRIALGASAREVVRLVISEGLRWPLAGLLLGIVGALALTRVMAHMLFGVTPMDPITFGAVAIVLAAVSFVACWFPARRAAGVDPVMVLRGN